MKILNNNSLYYISCKYFTHDQSPNVQDVFISYNYNYAGGTRCVLYVMYVRRMRVTQLAGLNPQSSRARF